MIRSTFLAALSIAVAGCAPPGTPGAGDPPRPEESPVSARPAVGEPAPDFTLLDQNRQPVTLSDFRGRSNVVLAFYVLAFTGG